MRQVDSTDFTVHFGEFVDLVREEPIAVRRGGKPTGVFLSPLEYERLRRLEDTCRAARALAAEERGEWVGPEEAMRLLTERLKRSKSTEGVWY